jgi:hypothetical protein
MKDPWYAIVGSTTYFANVSDLTRGGVALSVACPRECGRAVESVTPIQEPGAADVSYFQARCPCGALVKIVNDAGDDDDSAWERSRYPTDLRDIDDGEG